MQDNFPSLSNEEIYAPFHDDCFWSSLQTSPVIRHFVRQLCEDIRYDVYIVSATHSNYIRHKYEFLQKYFEWIPYNKIIFCHNKQLLNLDIMIDDSPDNLINANYYGILIDKPYNQDFKEKQHKNIVRAFNFMHACREIDKYNDTFNNTESYNTEINKYVLRGIARNAGRN